MKIPPLIVISTLLQVLAPAVEQTKEDANQTETRKPSDSEDSTFRTVKSPDGEAYFPPGKASYYTQYYKAAQLPSLQFKREEKGKVRFRLAILPTFTKPLFLTYSRGKEGASIEIKRIQLRLDKLGQAPSLEPGDVELAGKVIVGDRIAHNLESEAVNPEVRNPLNDLTEEQRAMYGGLDGCTWILEVSTETDYTMEDIWSPETISNIDPKILKKFDLPKVDTQWFVKFCDSLLEISDMKVSGYSVSALLDNEVPVSSEDMNKDRTNLKDAVDPFTK